MKPTPFTLYIEVVPPAHGDPKPVLDRLSALNAETISAFNVASNPVAKPYMSALVFAHLIQKRTGVPAVVHCTTRDHNRLSLQSLLWGAQALGISTLLVTTGDYPSEISSLPAGAGADVHVFQLLELAVKENFRVGVVYNPPAPGMNPEPAQRRLTKKVELGADFVLTQPIYNREQVKNLERIGEQVAIPVYPGVLPLVSSNHARYMHDQVDGIIIPKALLSRISESAQAAEVGLDNARRMLALIRHSFPGVCLMPPFQRYELVQELL